MRGVDEESMWSAEDSKMVGREVGGGGAVAGMDGGA